MKPFIKWTGGKSRSMKMLLPYLVELYDKSSLYIEPFLGGGSVVFQLQPSRAILNDLNANLISTYWCFKYHYESLCNRLETLEEVYNHSAPSEHVTMFNEYRTNYNKIKWNSCISHQEQTKEHLLDVAVHFMFLNKTSYNGMYRENKSGQFNVPFGKYIHISLVDRTNCDLIHTYLNQSDITLSNVSFEKLLTNDISRFYYFDPPYLEGGESKFTQYNANGFNLDQHMTLFNFMNESNCRCVCSNSASSQLTKIISDMEFDCYELSIAGCISSTENTRKSRKEVIVVNNHIISDRVQQAEEQIQSYCSGTLQLTKREDSSILSNPFVSMLCGKNKSSANSGSLAEYGFYKMCVDNKIPCQRPEKLKCRVRPDWKIVLNGTPYFVEIKSRSYTSTGTASEKLDNIPKKYSEVFEETGYKTIVVFSAGQINEKNAISKLYPSTDYDIDFVEQSFRHGIHEWTTHEIFKHKTQSGRDNI